MSIPSRKYLSSPGGIAAVTGCDSVQRRPKAASSGKAAGSYQHLGWGWPLFSEAGQVCLGHPFQGQDAHFLLPGLLEHLRSKIGLGVKDKVKREQNRVEVIAIHCGKSHFHRVGRETNETQLARLFGSLKGFHGAVGTENLFMVRHLRQRVKLVEVHVVGSEQPQGLVQQLGRTVPGQARKTLLR